MSYHDLFGLLTFTFESQVGVKTLPTQQQQQQTNKQKPGSASRLSSTLDSRMPYFRHWGNLSLPRWFEDDFWRTCLHTNDHTTNCHFCFVSVCLCLSLLSHLFCSKQWLYSVCLLTLWCYLVTLLVFSLWACLFVCLDSVKLLPQHAAWLPNGCLGTLYKLSHNHQQANCR